MSVHLADTVGPSSCVRVAAVVRNTPHRTGCATGLAVEMAVAAHD